MSIEIQQEIAADINIWLRRYVPTSLEEGLKRLRTSLQKAIQDRTGDPTSTVRIWVDYDKPTLHRFEYLYLVGPNPFYGWYLIDVQYWEVGEKKVDEEKVEEEANNVGWDGDSWGDEDD